ncbi:paeninodin family lasso peptide [Paenibacillus sp. WLX1005]
MEQKKATWHVPQMEILDVNQTMAGKGWRAMDWINYEDADVNNYS